MEQKKITRILQTVAAAGTSMMMLPVRAFAGFGDNVQMASNIDENFSDPDKVANTLIGFMLWAFRIVGIVMIMWGIYGFFTARRDGDGQELNAAMFKILAGIVLVAMKGVLSMVGVLA